jgi:hypothetical protein
MNVKVALNGQEKTTIIRPEDYGERIKIHL